MRRLALSLLAAVGLAGPLGAAEDAAVTAFTLDNGLEVVVIEDHRAPAVTHMLWYRAGSADEIHGESGVAHFLEHLMFKGTETAESGEFGRVVAANGGTDNAFTSFDYTGYFQRVAADRLGLMMRYEADRMRNLVLSETEIETERGVILEERNTRVENDPRALFREQRRAAQFLNHPYGRPIIGWQHEIERLDRDALAGFYDRFYAPNNAILIVAGDVAPDTVRTLAQEHYGPIRGAADVTVPTRVDEPPQRAERRLMFRDARIAQPYVIRTYLAPERDPGDQDTAAALTLLADLLGDGQNAILSRQLQFDSEVALYTSAFYSGTARDDTTFGLVVVPAPGVTLQDAERAMDAAVAQFLEDGIDAAHLERLKFRLRADQIYARDDVDGTARRYGRALTAGLTVEDVQAWPDILQAVNEDDILRAARAVLDRDTAVTGYLMSEDAPAPEEVTQ